MTAADIWDKLWAIALGGGIRWFDTKFLHRHQILTLNPLLEEASGGLKSSSCTCTKIARHHPFTLNLLSEEASGPGALINQVFEPKNRDYSSVQCWSFSYYNIDIDLQSLGETQQFCGDYIFSGHTGCLILAYLVVGYHFISNRYKIFNRYTHWNVHDLFQFRSVTIPPLPTVLFIGNYPLFLSFRIVYPFSIFALCCLF